MTNYPEPLTPQDCDLRGLAFMPLDTVRLLDSDFFALATAEEFRCAIVLWCKAWQQVPAGSLPDDDRILAHLSGARDKWCDMRDMSLHGFIKCSDGRLYHPVVCEKAIEAWPSRQEFNQKKTTAAERKARERQDRSELFSALKAIGITPDFSTKTSELRKIAVTHKVTIGHSDNGVTGHTPVTAKRGRGTGIVLPLSDDKGLDGKIGSQDDESSLDPDKVFWDEAKAYLGKSKAGLIGKWVAEFGRDAVADAVRRSKAEGDGAGAVDPPAFIVGCLKAGQRRTDAKAKEQAAADAAFFARHPPIERSDDEWRALLGDEEFERRQAERGRNS